LERHSRKSIAALLTFLAIIFNPYGPDVHGHSAGTDANGGHYDRKTGEYHYHSSRKPESRQSKAWTGKVVGVSDGDTIKVLRAGQQVKIRLYGVDTPEKKQAFGQAAKRFTAGMVAGKVVGVDPVDVDRYGRAVGLVVVNGVSLNAELVRGGYAWVLSGIARRRSVRIGRC
jgi:endonuclease YncB( thermonuclease family)